MPLMLMLNRVGSVWRTNLGMLRLMLLLIWVGVISLSCSLMLGVSCSRPVIIGILLFSSFTGS